MFLLQLLKRIPSVPDVDSSVMASDNSAVSSEADSSESSVDTTSSSQASGEDANIVAAITSEISKLGTVQSYQYREDDSTYSYYYFFTTDGNGYSIAYNKL